MRIRAERVEAERLDQARAQANAVEEKREALAAVEKDLNALFSEPDAHKRGKALEGVLNRLFSASGILVEEAFTLRGEPGDGIIEQIDGVVRVDLPCLVEMKWLKDAVGPSDAAQHLVRVYHRPAEVRGLLISANGFTPAVEANHRDAIVKGRVVALCGIDELVHLLREERGLAHFLRAKMDAAAIHRNPFHRPLG